MWTRTNDNHETFYKLMLYNTKQDDYLGRILEYAHNRSSLFVAKEEQN